MKLEIGMNLDICNDLNQLFENNSYQIIYENHWSDYEESSFIYILEKDGKYYEYSHQNSVMSDDNTMYWEPVEVTQKEIFLEIINWEKDQENIFFAILKDAWEAVNYNNYLKHFIYSNDEFPLEFIYSKSPNKFTFYTNPLLCISDIEGNIDDYMLISTPSNFFNIYFDDVNYPFKRKNLRSIESILDNNIMSSFMENNKIEYLFEKNDFVPAKTIFNNTIDINNLPYRDLLNNDFRECINELHETEKNRNNFFY